MSIAKELVHLQLEYIYKNCSKTFAISILVFDNPSLCSDLYVIDIFQINLTLCVYTTFFRHLLKKYPNEGSRCRALYGLSNVRDDTEYTSL